jgi:hypothetical protein
MSLFQSDDQQLLRDFLATDLTMEMGKILPYIKEAERDVLIPLIGQDFFDELESAASSSASGSSDTTIQDTLISKFQNAVANIAVYLGADRLRSHISSAGMHEHDTEYAEPLTWQMVRDIKREHQKAGYNALEDGMKYLFSNRDDFDTWLLSDEFNEYKEFFISEASEFSKYENINDSFLSLQALRPVIRRVEEFVIKPLIGETIFNSIKSELLSEGSGSGSTEQTIGTDNEALLDLIKPALAHHTIAQAIQDNLPIYFDGSNITVAISRLDFYNAADGVTTVHTRDMIKSKAAASLRHGRAYMEKLERYLQENASASKYPSFFNSDLYEADYADGDGRDYENFGDDTTYIF